jgi:hypothetical protein
MPDLPPVDWLLALDVSTVATGWAAGLVTANQPHVGLWNLPGMADQGVLYGDFWDRLERWCNRRPPDLMVFVRPFLSTGSIASEGLGGMAAVLHLFCHKRGIPLRRIDEGNARRTVIRPTITREMAQANKIATAARKLEGKKGSGGAGSKLVKAAALEWAAANGIDAVTHDVADAAVLWEYTRGIIPGRNKRAA